MAVEKLTYEKTNNPNVIVVNGRKFKAEMEFKAGNFYRCVNGAVSSNCYTDDIVLVSSGDDVVQVKGRDVGEVLEVNDLNEEAECWEEITYEQFKEALK